MTTDVREESTDILRDTDDKVMAKHEGEKIQQYFCAIIGKSKYRCLGIYLPMCCILGACFSSRPLMWGNMLSFLSFLSRFAQADS